VEGKTGSRKAVVPGECKRGKPIEKESRKTPHISKPGFAMSVQRQKGKLVCVRLTTVREGPEYPEITAGVVQYEDVGKISENL